MLFSSSTVRSVRVHPFAAIALCLAMLGGTLFATVQASAASRQMSPDEMIASLDGLESAFARRYVFEDESSGFPDATPITAEDERDSSMTSASITILQFATDADAESAWKLTSGSLVASAITGERPPDLEATEVPDLGDTAMMYLLSDATGSDSDANGVILVRAGTMGIIIEGNGGTTNAALGERLQEFAQFALDHEPTTPEVTVLAEGAAEGGDFDRMPGADDADVLRGLVPMWDYDLTVNNHPILPGDATPVPPCGCTPPEQG